MLLAEASLKHLHTRYEKCDHPVAIYNYAAAEYICSTAIYIQLTAPHHNYIPGCFNLQWRATSNTRAYIHTKWYIDNDNIIQ